MPAASEQKVLSMPGDLLARLKQPGTMGKTAAAMLVDFDKNDDATYAKWFALGHPPEGFPPRAGHFMGLRMVEELARSHTLYQLAHLTLEEEKALAKTFLEEHGGNPHGAECGIHSRRQSRGRWRYAGMAARDVVTMINGRRVRDEELGGARRMLRDKPAGTKFTLLVRRGTETHSVTLILKDQI